MVLRRGVVLACGACIPVGHASYELRASSAQHCSFYISALSHYFCCATATHRCRAASLKFERKRLGGHPLCPPRMGCAPATPACKIGEFIGKHHKGVVRRV